MKDLTDRDALDHVDVWEETMAWKRSQAKAKGMLMLETVESLR